MERCVVCTTLGMLTADQAKRLKEAGLSAYNHNLDTSREFYPEVLALSLGRGARLWAARSLRRGATMIG